jgi:hypothetical protein
MENLVLLVHLEKRPAKDSFGTDREVSNEMDPSGYFDVPCPPISMPLHLGARLGKLVHNELADSAESGGRYAMPACRSLCCATGGIRRTTPAN